MLIPPVRSRIADPASRIPGSSMSSSSIYVLACPYMESRAERRRAVVPVPPGLRPDPEVRRKLSGPALRTFFNISAAWALSVQEQRALLGWPAASTFHKYKSGDHGTLSFDTLTRISLVIG